MARSLAPQRFGWSERISTTSALGNRGPRWLSGAFKPAHSSG